MKRVLQRPPVGVARTAVLIAAARANEQRHLQPPLQRPPGRCTRGGRRLRDRPERRAQPRGRSLRPAHPVLRRPAPRLGPAPGRDHGGGPRHQSVPAAVADGHDRLRARPARVDRVQGGRPARRARLSRPANASSFPPTCERTGRRADPRGVRPEEAHRMVAGGPLHVPAARGRRADHALGERAVRPRQHARDRTRQPRLPRVAADESRARSVRLAGRRLAVRRGGSASSGWAGTAGTPR